MPYCLNKLRKQELFNLCVMMNILLIAESTESLLGNLIFLNCNQKYKGRKYFELKEGNKKKLIPRNY